VSGIVSAQSPERVLLYSVTRYIWGFGPSYSI